MIDRTRVPNAAAIIRRLREATSADTDTELADMLGVRQNTVSSWKSRNSPDYELIIAFCDQEDISLDWLFSIGIGISGPVGIPISEVDEVISLADTSVQDLTAQYDVGVSRGSVLKMINTEREILLSLTKLREHLGDRDEMESLNERARDLIFEATNLIQQHAELKEEFLRVEGKLEMLLTLIKQRLDRASGSK